MNNNLWVEISVTIQDAQYNYQSLRTGQAKMTFTLKRSLLEHLDSNAIIAGQIAAALANFDNCEVETEEENDTSLH